MRPLLLLLLVGCAATPRSPERDALQFERERVELTMTETGFHVDGEYFFVRGRDAAGDVLIDFPVPWGTEALDLEVEGAHGRTVPNGAQLLLSLVEGQRDASLRIHYRQELGARRARYIVTSALTWPAAVSEAVFVVHAPRAWGKPATDWPAPQRSCTGERCDFTWRFAPFRPASELAIDFGGL